MKDIIRMILPTSFVAVQISSKVKTWMLRFSFGYSSVVILSEGMENFPTGGLRLSLAIVILITIMTDYCVI